MIHVIIPLLCFTNHRSHKATTLYWKVAKVCVPDPGPAVAQLTAASRPELTLCWSRAGSDRWHIHPSLSYPPLFQFCKNKWQSLSECSDSREYLMLHKRAMDVLACLRLTLCLLCMETLPYKTLWRPSIISKYQPTQRQPSSLMASEWTNHILSSDLRTWLSQAYWGCTNVVEVWVVVLHRCPQEDEGVPLGDILHLAFQVERLFWWLPHVLKYSFAALSWVETKGFWWKIFTLQDHIVTKKMFTLAWRKQRKINTTTKCCSQMYLCKHF